MIPNAGFRRRNPRRWPKPSKVGACGRAAPTVSRPPGPGGGSHGSDRVSSSSSDHRISAARPGT
eukprot:751092-Hanusia_phi.AAC.2